MDHEAVSIMVAVIAVGVTLGSMIRDLRHDLGRRIDGLDERMRTLEAAQARLSGLLEGLGLTGRARPDDRTA